MDKNFEIVKNESDSKLKNEANEKVLLNKKCYWCGSESHKIASHSVPNFVLRNIGIGTKKENIKIKGIDSILGNYGLKKNDRLGKLKKTNRSGTFKLLCEKCEKGLFGKYEEYFKSDNIEFNSIKQRILSEITLKNLLRNIYKTRIIMRNIYIGIKKIQNLEFYFPEKSSEEIKKLKEDYSEAFEFHKKWNIELEQYDNKYITKNFLKDKNNFISNTKYKIGYHISLDYCIPLALQVLTEFLWDLEGKEICNGRELIPEERRYIQICVFPLENKSEIFMFVEEYNVLYDNFFKQLKDFSKEEQLKRINYIIFAFNEDYYYSPLINYKIEKNLKNIASEFKVKVDEKKLINESLMKKIPNLLSEKYSIENLKIKRKLL